MVNFNSDFNRVYEELEAINEETLKTWKVSYYEDGVKKSFTVQANSKAEAEQIGWSRVAADSLYVSEVVTEATNINASKKFWAAAKEKQIDEEAFHAAYDEELAELGLLDAVFNTNGTFKSYGIYSKIKEAKDANPDSWAVKALQKLWVLRYKDNVRFPSEVAAANALADQIRADQEAKRLVKENTFKEHQKLLKTYISQIDPVILADFERVAGIPAIDGVYLKTLDTESPKAWKDKPINKYGIYFKGWNKFYPVLETQFTNEAAMIRILASSIATATEGIQTNASTERFKQIDVFAKDKYARAVLLGDSGTLYDISGNYFGEIQISVNDGKPGVINKIDEPYKVIYTCTQWSDGNHSTRRDSESAIYYSWNSKYADKLGNRIPTEFGRTDNYIGSYSETKQVTNPDSSKYSHEDGIDSWAVTNRVDRATD